MIFAAASKHPRAIVAAFLLAAVACAAMTEFRIGHSYLDWIDTDSAAYARYQRFVDTFGDADTLLAVFELERLDKDTVVAYFGLLDRIRRLDGVVAVYEPAGLLLGASEDFAPEAIDVATLRDALQAKSPDYRSTIISRDTKTAGVLILVDSSKPESQARVLATVEQGFANIGIAVDLAGTVYISEALKRAIAADMALVNTLLMLAAIVLLIYFFRSPLLALCIAAGIGLAVLYALAFCMALGLSLNLLTLLLLPLVFCVGLTTAVHLFSRRQGDVWSFSFAIARIARPATIAALTTAIGCASFAAAPQPIIARMGLVLPVGVLCAFVTILLFVPALLAVLARGRALPAMRHGALQFGTGGRRRISVVLVALTVAAGMLLPGLRTNPDAIFFFDADSNVIRSYERIEQDLTGLLVVDMVIRSDSDVVLTDEGNAAKVQRLVRDLAGIPELSAAVSGYGWLGFSRLVGAPAELGARYFSADGRTTRVTLRLRNVTGRSYAEIVRHIAAVWAAADMTGLNYELTGVIPLILDAQDHLLSIQGMMLPIVVAAVCVALALFLRSPRLLAFALVANFIPLVLMAGTMVWLGIPINSINLFVSSVMIGVIVDDTVHLLHAYQATGSMSQALSEVGSAIWITSIIVCIAFASLLVSNLVPIHQFGLLSIVAVASAWFCDICLLPSLSREVRSPP